MKEQSTIDIKESSTANSRAKRIANEIGKKLEVLSSREFEQCIFKVPNWLRAVNENAYDPRVVAIGPYHHGKHCLMAMEEHKARYLRSRLSRINENSVERFVEALIGLEERIRRCYEPTINVEKDKLVEMMILDGFFIIEYFCRIIKPEWRDDNDPILFRKIILTSINADIIMLENQLPYFVLEELFNMTNVTANDMNVTANDMNATANDINVTANDINANLFFGYMMDIFSLSNLRGKYGACRGQSTHEIKHLLGLFYDNIRPSYESLEEYKKNEKDTTPFMCCATELQEAGIKFKAADLPCNFFDIKFENGVLIIPTLIVYDETETILRNVVAYEQLADSKTLHHVIGYLKFMDFLINTAKDVKLLCKCRIIVHSLGDEEAVATMFNKLTKNVLTSSKYFYFEVTERVNKHYGGRWNLYKAKLRSEYFYNPWRLFLLWQLSS